MRRFSMILLAGSAVTFIGAIWGCGDLLHSTDFTQAETTRRDDSAVNFCSWTESEAQSNAIAACTRLIACEKGFGADAPNAIGECVKRANLAYNCRIAPSRQVTGTTRKFWDCLWRAQACDGDRTKVHTVAECLMKDDDGGVASGDCTPPGDFTGCQGSARIECREQGKPVNVDPCVATGRTCHDVKGVGGVCTGPSEPVPGGCAKTGCADNLLHACSDSGAEDRGIDCAGFGKGNCVMAGDAGFPACETYLPPEPPGGVPDGGWDAAAYGECTPTGEVSCSRNVASSCPSGRKETVDCGALGLNCMTTDSKLGDPWDVARACRSTTPICSADTCKDGKLSICIRGSSEPILFDCAALNLKTCVELPLYGQITTQATCGDPLSPQPR